jgi:hypothetical protein
MLGGTSAALVPSVLYIMLPGAHDEARFVFLVVSPPVSARCEERQHNVPRRLLESGSRMMDIFCEGR